MCVLTYASGSPSVNTLFGVYVESHDLELCVERLNRRTLRALLDILQGLHVIQNVDAFAANIVGGLPKVVSSDVTVYSEVNLANIRRIEQPVVTDELPGITEAFERHMLEHPILAHHLRTRDGAALKISDFLSQSQWHRLGLYNEFFRRLGIEREMVVGVPTLPPRVIGIALHRSRTDFTERDRLCLNLLRPHLIQAHRNAGVVTEMEREVTLVTQGIEMLRGGMIVLTSTGGVRVMSGQARLWLDEYFGSPTRHTADLPEALRDWIGYQEALQRKTDDVPPPPAPFVVKGPGKQLVVRLLSEPGRCLLLLEERRTVLEPSSLEPLGLTPREAQVLAWVAEGRSNEHVARILGVAPLTVKKHLEHVYQKLGVESRTAAAARAREAVTGER